MCCSGVVVVLQWRCSGVAVVLQFVVRMTEERRLIPDVVGLFPHKSHELWGSFRKRATNYRALSAEETLITGLFSRKSH